MSRVVPLAATVGLMALVLSACGIAAKPTAGSSALKNSTLTKSIDLVDSPLTKQLKCLKTDKLHPKLFRTERSRLPGIQIGEPNQGPTLVFYATPGLAQGEQIQGDDEGAEAIGSALLYPNTASAKLLTKVEDCAAVGVKG